MVYNHFMGTTEKAVRQASSPFSAGQAGEILGKKSKSEFESDTRRISWNRIRWKRQEKRRFFELADLLSRSTDAKERQELKEKLARMTFGEWVPKIRWTNLPPALRDDLLDQLEKQQMRAEDLYKLKLSSEDLIPKPRRAIGIKIWAHSNSAAGESTPRHSFFEGNLPIAKNVNQSLWSDLFTRACVTECFFPVKRYHWSKDPTVRSLMKHCWIFRFLRF